VERFGVINERVCYSIGPSCKKNEAYALDSMPPDTLRASNPRCSSRSHVDPMLARDLPHRAIGSAHLLVQFLLSETVLPHIIRQAYSAAEAKSEEVT
jgi:hypothetical protein